MVTNLAVSSVTVARAYIASCAKWLQPPMVTWVASRPVMAEYTFFASQYSRAAFIAFSVAVLNSAGLASTLVSISCNHNSNMALRERESIASQGMINERWTHSPFLRVQLKRQSRPPSGIRPPKTTTSNSRAGLVAAPADKVALHSFSAILIESVGR